MTGEGRGRAIVVTGASGLLGRYLCDHLRRRGWRVRALVRRPDSVPEMPQGIEIARCDLPDKLDESLLAGASVLVHGAYATRAKSIAEARRVNEEGTLRVLEASRRAGIPRFVFISSLVAHPEAPSYYARSKYELEGFLDGTRDLALRPGLILAADGHGLFQRLRDSMKATRLVLLFDRGRQPLQTVHIDDVCEALSRALDRELTGVLSVAEPVPVPLATFLRMIADRLRLRCLFLTLPAGPVLAALRVIEALRVPFPLSSENLLGVRAMRHVDVTADLQALDLVVRPAAESLAEVL